VAKNRHFRQGVSGSDGWNFAYNRPQAVNLSMDWRYRMIIKSLSAAARSSHRLAVVLSGFACCKRATRRQLPVGCRERLLRRTLIVQVIGLRTLIALEMLIPIGPLPVHRHGPRPDVCRLRNDGACSHLIDPSQVDGIIFGLSLCAAVVGAGFLLSRDVGL